MRLTNAFLVPMLIVGLAATAPAQIQQPQPQPGQQQQQPGQQQQTKQMGPLIGEDSLRLSEVQGMTVMGSDDQELGTINDLVVTTKDNKIRYAALETGGFLGIGSSLHAVPWKQFKIKQQQNQVTLVLEDVSQKDLEDAEGYDQNDWPKQAEGKLGEKKDKDSDKESKEDKDSDKKDGQQQQGQQAQQGQLLGQQQPGIGGPESEIFRLSRLIGLTVVAKNNEELGTIEDVVAKTDGKLAYATLSTGGTFGIGGDIYAVPVDELKITTKDREVQLKLDIDEKELMEMVKIEGDQYLPVSDFDKKMDDSDIFTSAREESGN